MRFTRGSILSRPGFAQKQRGPDTIWPPRQQQRRISLSAKQPGDRQEITRYIYSHLDSFQIRLLASPEALDREDLRLRISCEEDWEHAATIVDALGEEAMEWQRIAGLLEGQPALRQRMAVLNQRAAVG